MSCLVRLMGNTASVSGAGFSRFLLADFLLCIPAQAVSERKKDGHKLLCPGKEWNTEIILNDLFEQ